MMVGVLPDGVHKIRTQTVTRGVSGENAIFVARHATVFGCHPQSAVAVFEQADKAIAEDAASVAFVENRKAHTIITHHAIKRRKP